MNRLPNKERVIRVVVASRSGSVREAIKAFLAQDSNIMIAGEGASAQEAVDLAGGLMPDLVILDMETPWPDGLEAIEAIVQRGIVSILVVTGKGDLRLAYKALRCGAAEVLQRPVCEWADQPMLLHKIKSLADLKVFVPKGTSAKGESRLGGALLSERSGWFCEKVVVVASSLGGPQALKSLFSPLPSSFPWPILVAQHISDGFAQGLADLLNRGSALDIQVATQNAPLLPGQVLINPPEYNMSINVAGAIKLHARQDKQLYHPSCDHLLSSVADFYGERTVGIILTGMGNDGVEGIDKIKKLGGVTIAQSEESCTLYGMPKAAIESGCVDRVLPVESMAGELMRLVAAR